LIHSRIAVAVVIKMRHLSSHMDALNVLVKAKGYAAVAQKTRLNRIWLYKAISPSANPGIRTIVALLSAFDFRLCVKRRANGSDEHVDDKDQFMAGN